MTYTNEYFKITDEASYVQPATQLQWQPDCILIILNLTIVLQ